MENKREIGSEFWDIPIANKINNCFPKSTQWFLSGRSALLAIAKELKYCRTVAMPSWFCDSMVKPFIDTGIEVEFYSVYWRDGLIQDVHTKSDILFLIDYFGYTTFSCNLDGYKGLLIRDLTHSLFSSAHMDADYYFGSLRKWCGVWTGGYAWTKDGHQLIMDTVDDQGYIMLRKKAMKLKNDYINNNDRYDRNQQKYQYLKIYEEAEKCLENIGIAPATERDIFFAKLLNIEWIKTRRRKNAKILMDAFQNYLIFSKLNDEDCPMFVPILVPDGRRNELRGFLKKHDIYCPIHWPISRYHSLDAQEREIYDNELSLVCDQRYTEDDMKRIVEVIQLFWEER